MVSFSKLLLILPLLIVTFNGKSQVVGSPPKPYSPYRMSNGMIFISGQLGIIKPGGEVVRSGFEAEVNQVMQNLKTVLNASGADLSSVINVVVYLKNMNRYAEFNKIYLKYFSAPYPSRSCIAVKGLARGANIEISAVAEQKTP